MNNEIEKLISLVAKLPGLGKRSARRIALHLLINKENILHPLIDSMRDSAEKIVQCKNCGNIDTTNPCGICNDSRRQHDTLCIVENVAEVWAFERAEIYNGVYHVLGGVLSGIDGVGPDKLNIPALLEKIDNDGFKEVIIATNPTIEGQTTAHYINNHINKDKVKVTQLAHGIPLGAELDYMDEGTLNTALQARKEVA